MGDTGPQSSQTLVESSPPPPGPKQLNLSKLPPIFLSGTHFEIEDLHEMEDELSAAGANLTYDIHEAKIVLSKATKKARARFDLREKGLWTEEAKNADTITTTEKKTLDVIATPSKKRKREQAQILGKGDKQAIVINDSSTASEDDEVARSSPVLLSTQRLLRSAAQATAQNSILRVLKMDWFERSREAGYILPLEEFTTYHGRRVEKPIASASLTSNTSAKRSLPVSNILERAKEDASQSNPIHDRYGKRKIGPGSRALTASPSASWAAGYVPRSQYAPLLHQTTTEHDEGISSDLSEPPQWVKQGVKYACQRVTPRNSPNQAFIRQLKTISTARLLTNDEIGVRAYSTSIASIAAYPYKITNAREIMKLPGCEAKVANLFVEWTNTGKIHAVEDFETDEELKIVRLFYNIWGVGATTARDFFYNHAWKTMDDIIDHGWKTLSRVQQIGIKFYDEFLDLISRAEVEDIGKTVHQHAVKMRDHGIQTMIVGGYRRGKEACGDVDIIVSHPNEAQTADLISDIVNSLEDEGWITHTLHLSEKNTKREQKPLPFKSGSGGHGFDSLDKALVVWQDPIWPTRNADLAADPKAKSPNIHRRVDIIIAPWSSVGCAIVGWSGGTTFERDLRRYAKNVKGWKFDSSGVRDRGTGEIVDVDRYYVDGGRERAKTMREAEKRVFEGMGLEYREPWDRCTG